MEPKSLSQRSWNYNYGWVFIAHYQQIFSVCLHLEKNKMCLWNTMPPIMANSNEGQDHKDKYFDTSRKILSQEMIMYKPLVSYL